MRQRDFRALMEFLAGLAGVRTITQYSQHTLQGLQSLVACDHLSYNELPFPEQRPRFAIVPAEATTHITREMATFRRYAVEHPILAHYAGTKPELGWVRLSDFMTRREFRRTALYNEYYRRVGVGAQLVLIFPSSRAVDIAISINRAARDFDERDRATLNLLQGPLRIVYEVAETSERVERHLELVMAGTARTRLGVAIVADGRIRTVNQTARKWLHDYFGAAASPEQLPGQLEQWLAAYDARSSAVASHRLIKTVGNRQLTVRAACRADDILLLLEENWTVSPPEALISLGLTRRESEVLSWVAEGKTNPEIGMILGRSSRTVQHHLDAIFRKLGVETRTAAAARALATAAAFRQIPESDAVETTAV